jgi:hypothetical protein
MKKNKTEITRMELADTVFKLQAVKQYETKPITELVPIAYDLLERCDQEIDFHTAFPCSYDSAIRRVTGAKRVGDAERKRFELFFDQTFPPFMRQALEERWKVRDEVPVSFCEEAAPKYRAWAAEQLSQQNSRKAQAKR